MMIFDKSRFLKIFTIASFLVSCESDGGFDPTTEQRIDFEKFTLVTPLDWVRFYPQGTDGFFGGLTNNRDTLYFDYGVFSFSSIDGIKENNGTISFQELMVGGYSSKIVLEKREGEISTRFSFYSDKKDGKNLNRVYCYAPVNQGLIKSIFLSHRFK
jgi:hypothetical protein